MRSFSNKRLKSIPGRDDSKSNLGVGDEIISPATTIFKHKKKTELPSNQTS